jgi:hypothetical protein
LTLQSVVNFIDGSVRMVPKTMFKAKHPQGKYH